MTTAILIYLTIGMVLLLSTASSDRLLIVSKSLHKRAIFLHPVAFVLLVMLVSMIAWPIILYEAIKSI